jgi:hypothetical protein
MNRSFYAKRLKHPERRDAPLRRRRIAGNT